MSLWKKKEVVGGCSFCSDRNYHKVLEFYGKTPNPQLVRFCRKCLAELNKKARM